MNFLTGSRDIGSATLPMQQDLRLSHGGPLPACSL